MTLTEKAAYLKGLAEGLKLDESKDEVKLIKAIMDVIDDLALTASDLEDSVAQLGEQLDAVDEDLDDLESYIFDEDDDEDEDFYEVQCPSCGETINVDADILEDGSIECPACGETLEFEFGPCECGECDDEEDDD